MPPPPMAMPSGAPARSPDHPDGRGPAGAASRRIDARRPAGPKTRRERAATPAAQPQRVASLQPVAAAEPASEAAQAAVGGFSVQLGVRNSEADAQKAFAQMQSKYADLQGQPALIRKAEVNG